MVEYPQIDKYADIESPIHHWDIRVKLISILALIFSVVLVNDLKTAFLGLSFALVLLAISKIPVNFIFIYLRWISAFIGFIFIILTFTAGVEKASLVSLRALTAFLLIFPLLATARFETTLKALEKIGVPDKLIQTIQFTYRYIFVFACEIRTMFRALKSRGFNPGTNLWTMKTTGKVIGMLFVRSFERSERVYNAMVSRGYTGTVGTMTGFKMNKLDLIKGFIVISFAVLLHYVELIS